MLTKSEQLDKALKRVRLQLGQPDQPAYPAFVFGAQRSGTDMVASVFNNCQRVECYNESDPEAFDRFVLRGEDTVRRLVKRSRATAVFFKSILNSQNARALLDLDANAKAIWLFRSYPDVVNSNLKRFKSHFRDLTEMVHDPERAGWRIENVTAEDMELVRKYQSQGVSDASARALLWFLRNQLLFQQKLDSDPRVFIANYDRIVTDPVAAFDRIFAFFRLPFNPRFVRHVQSSSIAKEAPPEIDPEIKQLCERMFEKLNGVAAL